MSETMTVSPVPRLALSAREAAAALGCSLSTFNREIRGELRAVRQGRKSYYAVSELQRWLDENSERTLERWL